MSIPNFLVNEIQRGKQAESGKYKYAFTATVAQCTFSSWWCK